ncbi:hypothetical protein [Actinospongicola halichondriae]|uniref:hypothetical protein n=1 Tax=Actinospongicola halichondriae TaxID=3236844 RepID=UPI003D39C367
MPALLLALVVAVAACGGDGAELDRAGTTASSTVPPISESSTVPDGGTSPDGGVPDTEGGSPSPGPDSTPTAPSTSTPVSAPGRMSVPREGAVGAFGPWYLRADQADSIVLEVRSQSGAEPEAATVDRIRSLLAQTSGKTVTLQGGSVPGGARQWTPSAIVAEADRTGPAQGADAAVLTLLFVHGGLADADQTVGVAVRSDVAAVFSDRVDEAAGPLVASTRVEAAVTTHEVGHLLGLVDLVLATGRADPEHPGHSASRGSVMYYAVESTLVGDLLTGGPPTDFDEADIADLRAIAGR